jgi:Bacterial Ig-like domain (group 2)
MRDRSLLAAVLSIGLVMPFIGCSNPKGLDSIQITPSSSSLTVGQTTQFTATGQYGNAAHPSAQDITGQVTWTSASTGIAQVGATGLLTAEGNGTTTITASAKGYNGPVSSSATVTVTGGGSGGGPVSSTSLISLTIIPSSISVGNLEDTGNFLAIGTYSVAPQVRDVTNSVVWTSSFPNSFPVNSNTGGNVGATAGIVTAYGSGTGATIMAEVADPVTKSIQYATATFACPYVAPCPCSVEQGCSTPITSCPSGPVAGSCYPNSQASALLSTVTVYNEGLNDTNWYVTAPSATGTPDVVHCGPGWTLNGGLGGSVCVATYPVGTPFVLTAPAGAGAFGGWSSNCTPVVSPTNLTPANITANGPNYCELNPTTSSETVGAIFN